MRDFCEGQPASDGLVSIIFTPFATARKDGHAERLSESTSRPSERSQVSESRGVYWYLENHGPNYGRLAVEYIDVKHPMVTG